jgi:hypothetical protein
MSTLTNDEKTILTNALPGGDIYMMRAGQVGDFVRSGQFDFLDQSDPALQARGVDALDRLMQLGWVRHERNQLYKLTGTGFEQARQFAN